MANEFKVEVPISIKGGNAGKSLANDFLKNIKGSFSGFGKKPTGDNGSGSIIGGLGKIAASVGIIASIWQGIAPIFKPVLKMFSILLTLLLLPLMPLIRTMVSGLAKTAGKVGEAQEAAGGGYAGLIAGFGEVMKSPTIWAMAGVGIAASFIASLGTISLVGLILAGISLSLIWESITKGDEETLSGKLGMAGWAGVSAAIAALIFGAKTKSIGIGLLAFELSLGLSFLKSSVKEEDLKTAILEMVAGSIMMGLVANKVIALLGLGGAIGGAGVMLGVGTITFLLFAEWKWQWMEKASDWVTGQIDNLKEVPSRISSGNFNLIESIFGKKETGLDIIYDFNLGVAATRDEIDRLRRNGEENITALSSTIGGTNNNASLVSSINTTNSSIMGMEDEFINMGKTSAGVINTTNSSIMSIGTEFINMKDVSVQAVNEVINNLDRIPREKNTTHYIRTVYI